MTGGDKALLLLISHKRLHGQSYSLSSRPRSPGELSPVVVVADMMHCAMPSFPGVISRLRGRIYWLPLPFCFLGCTGELYAEGLSSASLTFHALFFSHLTFSFFFLALVFLKAVASFFFFFFQIVTICSSLILTLSFGCCSLCRFLWSPCLRNVLL